MATLTPEQIDFLTRHKIPLDKAFDASGLSSKDYKAKMKQNGSLVAFGVPPCPKGHTLRNKQANCVECNPQAVASLKRQATAGDVYIVVSPSQLLIKIGACETADNIIQQMNAKNHAQINDWQLVLLGKTDSIGQLENQLQQRLAEHQLPKKLTKDSKTTKASQIYDMDIDDAIYRLNDCDFTLSHIDNSVLETFHQAYQQKIQQQQIEQAKLAQAQLEQQHAQEQAQAAAKQAELEQQKQQQALAKAQKAEQKRLRQQQLDAKKQATIQKSKQHQTTASSNDSLSKTPVNAISANKPIFYHDKKQRNLLIVFGIVSLIVLAMIMFALFNR